MLSLLFIFLFHKVWLTSAVDTIVSPQKDINWTSQTFIIPPGALPKDPGSHCAAHSRFYCLNAYETTISLEEQQFGYGYGYQHVQGDVPEEEEEVDDIALEYNKMDVIEDPNLSEYLAAIKSSIFSQCVATIRPIHRFHNIYRGVPGCCVQQCDIYFIHGYQKMFLTIQEYMAKFIDYNEENKTLNLIEAYFSAKCERNVITKLGFGEGVLVRANHPSDHMPQKLSFKS
ncbi:uncharacterized protein LOC142340854 isoform X1 [Convolutriloba macropyga]|uniref:uncharacterized protein LOC142340854 isoform X1 n=1 Tax=Convolutriloba macropyga TaxID=536237 RepID=UPI003F523E7E